MTLAGYMALLPDWWSRDWAKTMLLEFSAKDLNEAFKLILNRGFMEVSADGKGPLYFDTGSLKVKLRLLRLSPKEKSEVRQIILRDEAGAADLQRGVMNEALWAKLRREGLSPELTYSDDLSIYCGRPDRSESVCRAAALLLASWLVSSDPALMFAWRGLGIYDDLNIPRILVRHLPNGNEPAYVTHLPAARNVLLAEAEPKVLTEEGRAVAGRWATRPYALAWLLTELPLGADLSRADALAPRLGGFTISDSSRGRELRANLEIPDGQTGTVSVSFAKLSPGYEDRLRKYLSEHREECLTIGLKNDLTPGSSMRSRGSVRDSLSRTLTSSGELMKGRQTRRSSSAPRPPCPDTRGCCSSSGESMCSRMRSTTEPICRKARSRDAGETAAPRAVGLRL